MTRHPFQPSAPTATIPTALTFVLVTVLGLGLLATSCSFGQQATLFRSSQDASASDLGRAYEVRPAFASAGGKS